VSCEPPVAAFRKPCAQHLPTAGLHVIAGDNGRARPTSSKPVCDGTCVPSGPRAAPIVAWGQMRPVWRRAWPEKRARALTRSTSRRPQRSPRRREDAAHVGAYFGDFKSSLFARRPSVPRGSPNVPASFLRPSASTDRWTFSRRRTAYARIMNEQQRPPSQRGSGSVLAEV